MSAPSVTIDLSVTPYLNLALWNNQVPPIQQLRLLNGGDEELTDLTLTVSCSPPAFAAVSYPGLAVGREDQLAIPLERLSLDYELLKSLGEGAPGLIEVTVRGHYGYGDRYPCGDDSAAAGRPLGRTTGRARNAGRPCFSQ